MKANEINENNNTKNISRQFVICPLPTITFEDVLKKAATVLKGSEILVYSIVDKENNRYIYKENNFGIPFPFFVEGQIESDKYYILLSKDAKVYPWEVNLDNSVKEKKNESTAVFKSTSTSKSHGTKNVRWSQSYNVFIENTPVTNEEKVCWVTHKKSKIDYSVGVTLNSYDEYKYRIVFKNKDNKTFHTIIKFNNIEDLINSPHCSKSKQQLYIFVPQSINYGQPKVLVAFPKIEEAMDVLKVKID